MIRFCSLAFMVVVLGGCADMPQWAELFSPDRAPSASRTGQFNFGWALSGDPAVAPQQVFDDGRDVWLQFAPQVTLPAIFSEVEGRSTLLQPRKSGPYIVVSGTANILVFRGGTLQARARRTDIVAAVGSAGNEVSPAALPQAVKDGAKVVPVNLPAATQAKLSSKLAKDVGSGAGVKADQKNSVVRKVAAASWPVALKPHKPLLAPAVQIYSVGPSDGTLREALSRWAKQAGWSFRPEHWAVDVDIPIIGDARFTLPFVEAVRGLVASTELSDRPLQPCFYSNQVLRVVPMAQSCDRSRSRAQAS